MSFPESNYNNPQDKPGTSRFNPPKPPNRQLGAVPIHVANEQSLIQDHHCPWIYHGTPPWLSLKIEYEWTRIVPIHHYQPWWIMIAASNKNYVTTIHSNIYHDQPLFTHVSDLQMQLVPAPPEAMVARWWKSSHTMRWTLQLWPRSWRRRVELLPPPAEASGSMQGG